MAYSTVPSERWQEILDMEDETQQGIAATEYVNQLERKIDKLQRDNEKCAEKELMNAVGAIMKSEPFKSWLRKHDDEIYTIEQMKLSLRNYK